MMEMWFMPLLLFALQLGYSEGKQLLERENTVYAQILLLPCRCQ